MTMNPDDFGKSFKGFMEQMNAAAVPEESFRDKIEEHFGCDPGKFPSLHEKFESFEHPNIQLAFEQYLNEPGRSHELVGLTTGSDYLKASLANIIAGGDKLLGGSGISAAEGPVKYNTVKLDEDNIITCVSGGVYFIKDPHSTLVVNIQDGVDGGLGRDGAIVIEVLAPTKEKAERFLAQIRTLLRNKNVYKGHVISVSADVLGGVSIHMHKLPKVSRDTIILPQGLLEKIERQTVNFGKASKILLAAGRHLRTGLLLYGPPGTGKTLTAMYIASAIEERTVLLLTGRGFGLIEKSCQMAKMLQPAILILEDVDLIAEARDRLDNGCNNAVLFELLNEMDGLSDDSDIMFLLTTNRPEILEPALAARPGRIDQIYEIPLPDATCRKKLFELYAEGMETKIRSMKKFIDRTDGASAAFIRELLRKAALYATDDGDDLVVKDKHLDEALHDMVIVGGKLSKSILGFYNEEESDIN